jgi:hypothetical protein
MTSAAKLISSRLLASIYGRPPMISRASGVRLPSEVDRDYTAIDSDGAVLKERIPGASMFCLSVKLLNVFYEILETVYVEFEHQVADTSGPRDAELLGKSLRLNHQLDQWFLSMPDRLRCFVATPLNWNLGCKFSIHEQALVTRLVNRSLSEALLLGISAQLHTLTIKRFLYTRIILLRPLTLIIGNRNPRGALDLGSTVLKECCSLCLLSSELLVHSLRQDKASPRRLADWHAIYRNHRF